MNQSEIESVTQNTESVAEEIKEEAEGSPSLTEENDSTQNHEESAAGNGTQKTDYADLAKKDMQELASLFPHLRGKESVRELENPLRYAALRDLGLSPKEAYLATHGSVGGYDNRSHLRSAVPRGAASGSDMLGARELEAARELFTGLSDREIQKLYKRVSK